MVALLLVLALAPVADSPAEAERLFALGNRLLAADPGGAAAAYEGAAATGWTSPELELNLGKAYLDAGDLGRAVLHAERARRIAPRHPALAQRLASVREQVGAAQPPPRPAEATAQWLSAHVGASGMAAVLWMLYLAVLGLLGFRIWRREARPWWRRAMLVLVPLTVFVAGAAVLTMHTEAAPRGVLLAEASVHTTPSEAAEHRMWPEGTVLRLGEQRGLWQAVRLPGGGTGWVEASALETI